jgi:hypothetical protein
MGPLRRQARRRLAPRQIRSIAALLFLGCVAGGSGCNDSAATDNSSVDSGPAGDASLDSLASTVDSEAGSTTPPGDASLDVDSGQPFPSTPSTGTPISYGGAFVTDLTSLASTVIQTITPGAGTSVLTVADYNGFGTVPGRCVSIVGTKTAYDGGSGGTCAKGYQVVSVKTGNPATLVVATTVTASYSTAITSDSISLLITAKDGTILSFYRHGSTDVEDPGITVLRTSKDGGATWTPYAGGNYIRKADGTWATGVNGRCGAAIVDDMPGCLTADNSKMCNNNTEDLDVRNVSGGIAPDGTLVLQWALRCWKNPLQFFGIFYSSSSDNGATWSSPAQLTNIPSTESNLGWCGTYGGLISLPAGLAIGITGYPGRQDLCQVPGYGYLVLSHDNGRTWGVNTTEDFIRVKDDSHVLLPTNENSYAYLGNSQIIGFGRNGCPVGVCPLLFFYSPDLGKTWNITTTNFGPSPPVSGQTVSVVRMVSPWLFDAALPGQQLTLMFSERQQDTNGSGIDLLRTISFRPSAAIANPQAFGATQTLWTSEYVDWGYATVAQLSPFTILIQWDSMQYPAGPLNLFTMTASYGCSGPGPECQL